MEVQQPRTRQQEAEMTKDTPASRKPRPVPVGACKCGARTYQGHLKKTDTAPHVYTGPYTEFGPVIKEA